MTTLSETLSSGRQAQQALSLRAATLLIPSLQAAGAAPAVPVWRADEWQQSCLQADCTPSGFESLDRELPGRGWPQGQLIELLADRPGIGELSLLLPALAAVSRTAGTCVWVLPCEQGGTPSAAEAPAAAPPLPYAPALQEAGIDLARNIFVRPMTPRESGWALEQSLRAAHLGALLGWLPDGGSSESEFRCLRRLHLLAQRHRALVFILRSARHAAAPSPAALRLLLQHESGRLQVSVLKRRGRPVLEPVTLQIHPADWNRAPDPVPAVVRQRRAPLPAAFLLERVRSLAPAGGWTMQAILGH
jgi:cell division inhibitor SulA/protein ImuA